MSKLIWKKNNKFNYSGLYGKLGMIFYIHKYKDEYILYKNNSFIQILQGFSSPPIKKSKTLKKVKQVAENHLSNWLETIYWNLNPNRKVGNK